MMAKKRTKRLKKPKKIEATKSLTLKVPPGPNV